MAAFAPKDPSLAKKFFEDKLSFTTGPVELSKVLDGGSVRVVDVRSSEDFAREHIPGSINLPESEWPNASARGLAQDKTNVLVCYSQVCHLAARAAVQLSAQGFPVMELEGGFKAWKEHELPIEKSEAKADDAVGRARALLAETRAAEAKAAEAKPATESKPAAEPKPAATEPTPAAKPQPAADEKATEAKADDKKADGKKADGAKADDKKADDAKADDAKADGATANDAKPAGDADADVKADAKADADADAKADADARADAEADGDDSRSARRARSKAQRPGA